MSEKPREEELWTSSLLSGSASRFRRRLRILYELIAALLQPDLDDLLERLLERVVQLLGAERGYIFLRGEDSTVELRVSRGGDGGHARALVERVLSSGVPEYLVDGSEGSADATDPKLSIICVPFVHGETTTGALYLDSSTPFGSRFSLEEGHLLASLAGLAATAIENARAEMSRRRLEEQLQQAQKMETVGTLAGGIAHDFNNLLSAMIGTLSVLDWQIDADPSRSDSDLRDQLAILRDCALRAAEIVQQLLSLSRRGELKLSAVDLGTLIGDVVKLCRASFDPRIELEIQSSGEPAWVDAEPVRIKQALLNLAVNARDAMPDGGRITFDVRPVQRKDGRRFVRVIVRDTGKGIEAEHLPRVFDPFFTTKPVGKGTGLGLAMVYNIVSQHHGTVRVESHPDKGSAFSIDLPASSPTAYSAGIPPSELPHGTESILLVDDEQVVRQLARGMLQMLGYSVIVAADGEEAIRLLTTSHEQVDLVILDLIMPRMSGRDALLALRALRPALPILVSTGVQLDAQALGTRGIPISGVLAKPYDFTDLAIAVRLALDNAPQPRTAVGGTSES